MKKIIFATFLAFVVGNSSCKEKEVNPCEGTNNPSADSPKFRPALRLDNTCFYIKDKKGQNIRYLREEMKVYDAQQKLLPIELYDEQNFQSLKIAFTIKGEYIFTNPAFGANVPTSHTLYFDLKGEKDTLRFDTHIKSFCKEDSIGYLKTTQNSMKTRDIIINNLTKVAYSDGITIYLKN
jgi:hypothetical protein